MKIKDVNHCKSIIYLYLYNIKINLLITSKSQEQWKQKNLSDTTKQTLKLLKKDWTTIDTEDYVFGFKKTLRKRTKSMAKALQLERKLRNDVGRYLSASVRVVAVRLYNNGELRGEFKA